MKLVKLGMVIAAALAAQACSGTDGAAGQDGPAGSPGKPGESTTSETESSVSLVTPQRGILDREIEVQIGGSGTKFADGAKPDFGAGIDVVEVTTASPTLIVAKIRIAKNAAVGPRTVKVGDVVAQKAFTVIPAIEVKGAGGTAKVSQGSFVELGIENNDDKAFDTNTFTVEIPGMMDLGSGANGPQSATGFLLAAPLAKTGVTQVAAQNLGADGKPKLSFLSAPDALEVTARAPVAFDLGAPREETFGGGYETKLFKLSSPANEAAIVDYRVQVTADGTAKPVAFLFGSEGTADAQLGRAAPPQQMFGGYAPPPYDLHVAVPIAPSASPHDHYVIVADVGNQAGAKATVTASRVGAMVAFEAMGLHGQDAPQSVGAVTATAGQVVSAELKGADEVDAYKFTVTAEDKLQLMATSDADLEIVITKDPMVLEDPQGTPPAERKVLGYMYPGKKFAAQRALSAAIGATDVYAVVLSDVEGTVKTGKYTLGVRKLP